jgi:hypothetical protein
VGQSPEYLKKRAGRGDFPAYKEGKLWRVNKTALMAHVGAPNTEGGAAKCKR